MNLYWDYLSTTTTWLMCPCIVSLYHVSCSLKLFVTLSLSFNWIPHLSVKCMHLQLTFDNNSFIFSWNITKLRIVACTFNTATFEVNSKTVRVGSMPVGGNRPSVGGWIVWPPVIQHSERCQTKYWDLTVKLWTTRFHVGLK